MAVRNDADPAKVARLDQLTAEVADLDMELDQAQEAKRVAKQTLDEATGNVREVLSRRDPARDEMMRLVAELSDNVQGIGNL